MDELAIALAQGNPAAGDVEGNIELIRRQRAQGAALGAQLVVTSELSVVGYPPLDLVLQPAFVDDVRHAVERLAADTADGGPALLVGSPWRDKDGRLYNAALLLGQGRIMAWRAKHSLPGGERRVFASGPIPGPMALALPDGGTVRLGVMVGHDIESGDVAEGLGESGAEMLIVIAGSPFAADSHDQRLQLALARIVETGLPLLYVNQVGGQDELVFDGASFALDRDRALVAQAPMLEEAVTLTRWRRDQAGWGPSAPGERVPPLPPLEAIYRALVLGLRDHVSKNHFRGVVLELSGGLDPALSAAVAVDALGADRVRAVMLPGHDTRSDCRQDAAECARLLGIRLDEIAIQPGVAAFAEMLAPIFVRDATGKTDENIESLVRGLLLTTLADKLGCLLLTTGNKSANAGHARLAGGFPVLKDVYGTTALELSRLRNAARPAGCLGPDGPTLSLRVKSASGRIGLGEIGGEG